MSMDDLLHGLRQDIDQGNRDPVGHDAVSLLQREAKRFRDLADGERRRAEYLLDDRERTLEAAEQYLKTAIGFEQAAETLSSAIPQAQITSDDRGEPA